MLVLISPGDVRRVNHPNSTSYVVSCPFDSALAYLAYRRSAEVNCLSLEGGHRCFPYSFVDERVHDLVFRIWLDISNSQIYPLFYNHIPVLIPLILGSISTNASIYALGWIWFVRYLLSILWRIFFCSHIHIVTFSFVEHLSLNFRSAYLEVDKHSRLQLMFNIDILPTLHFVTFLLSAKFYPAGPLLCCIHFAFLCTIFGHFFEGNPLRYVKIILLLICWALSGIIYDALAFCEKYVCAFSRT